jgi:hypothetical protein
VILLVLRNLRCACDSGDLDQNNCNLAVVINKLRHQPSVLSINYVLLYWRKRDIATSKGVASILVGLQNRGTFIRVRPNQKQLFQKGS